MVHLRQEISERREVGIVFEDHVFDRTQGRQGFKEREYLWRNQFAMPIDDVVVPVRITH